MADEHKDTTHHSGSLHGFVLGILVGVAITLLFTTKKGRRILKSMTDEGMEKVSKWEDLINKKIDEKVNDINDDLEESEFVEVVEEPVSSVNEAAHVQNEKATPTPKESKKAPEKESEHTTSASEEKLSETKSAPASPSRGSGGAEVRHTVRRFFKTAKK